MAKVLTTKKPKTVNTRSKVIITAREAKKLK